MPSASVPCSHAQAMRAAHWAMPSSALPGGIQRANTFEHERAGDEHRHESETSVTVPPPLPLMFGGHDSCRGTWLSFQYPKKAQEEMGRPSHPEGGDQGNSTLPLPVAGPAENDVWFSGRSAGPTAGGTYLHIAPERLLNFG